MKSWPVALALGSSVLVGFGAALAYDRSTRRPHALSGTVEIVNGRRYDGSTNALVRSGYRQVPCKSGISSARCWSGSGQLRAPAPDSPEEDAEDDAAPDFGEDSWFERPRKRGEERRAAKRAQIRAAFAKSPAVILTNRFGSETLAIRSGEMQNPEYGSERLTYFYVDGPVRHHTDKTPEGLFDDAIGYGETARPASDAEVMAWTSTPEFEEGSRKVAEIQRLNARGLKGAKVTGPREIRRLPEAVALKRWAELYTTGKHAGYAKADPVVSGYQGRDATWVEVELPHDAYNAEWNQAEPMLSPAQEARARRYAQQAGPLPPGMATFRGRHKRAYVADGNHRAHAAFMRGEPGARFYMPLVEWERLRRYLTDGSRAG